MPECPNLLTVESNVSTGKKPALPGPNKTTEHDENKRRLHCPTLLATLYFKVLTSQCMP